MLESCILCGRRCGVDRLLGERGFCGGGVLPKIYRYGPHDGEEPVISGTNGSGTVFFSSCNLRCVYCQNHIWSQADAGEEIEISDLAKIFLILQDEGCHNINLVTSTHYIPQITAAVKIARNEGLNIPIVYNTSGYETREALDLLDGIIDIYLVDVKYSDDDAAERYSNVSNYVEVNKEALAIMFEQVKHLVMDMDGIAEKGLIVRHLVIPGHVRSSKGVLDTINKICGNSTFISLMSQYLPLHLAGDFPEIDRKLYKEEYNEILDYFLVLGFNNGWIQDLECESDSDLIGENMDGNW
ncbi:radical SAM protein [bacterium]|nr:radical SAM protein [bacterium]